MEEKLSETQELLLWKACKERQGTVSISLAKRMYSSKSSAKSAIQKLELFDYIESTAPGHWKVIKLPRDVKKQLKEQQENKDEDNEEDKKKSEYEIVKA